MLRGIEAGDILPLIVSSKLKAEELDLSFEDILNLMAGSEAEAEDKPAGVGKEGTGKPKAELMQILATVPALGSVLAQKGYSIEEKQNIEDKGASEEEIPTPVQGKEQSPGLTQGTYIRVEHDSTPIEESSTPKSFRKVETLNKGFTQDEKGYKPLQENGLPNKGTDVQVLGHYINYNSSHETKPKGTNTYLLNSNKGSPGQSQGTLSGENILEGVIGNDIIPAVNGDERSRAYLKVEGPLHIADISRKARRAETSPKLEGASSSNNGTGARVSGHLKDVNHYSSHETEYEGSNSNPHNFTRESPEQPQGLLLGEKIQKDVVQIESEKKVPNKGKVPKVEERSPDRQLEMEVYKKDRNLRSDGKLIQEHSKETLHPKRETTGEVKHSLERRDTHQERQGIFSQSVGEPKEEVKEEVHHTLRRDIPLQNRGEVRSVNVRFEDTHLRFRFQSENLNVEIKLREDIQRQIGYLDVQRLSRSLESLGLSLEGLRINGVELISRSQRHKEKERFNIRERDGAGEKASDSLSDSSDIKLLL